MFEAVETEKSRRYYPLGAGEHGIDLGGVSSPKNRQRCQNKQGNAGDIEPFEFSAADHSPYQGIEIISFCPVRSFCF